MDIVKDGKLGILFSALLLSMQTAVAAALVNAGVVVEPQNYGASYGEWSARLFQWYLSLPAEGQRRSKVR